VESIQLTTILRGVASEPEPQAMFSPTKLPGKPAALARLCGVLPFGATWSKQCALTAHEHPGENVKSGGTRHEPHARTPRVGARAYRS